MDLIRRQDAIDAVEKYLANSNVMDADVIAYEIRYELNELSPKVGVSDLISKSYLLGEIDEVDFYTVYNGKLVQGAESRETALYKAMDIYGIIEELPSAEQSRENDAEITRYSRDAISRQDILALAKDVTLENGCKHRCIDATQIYELPSAQPERKTGMWIDFTEEGFVECPFCHSATNCDDNKDELHYCFSCGAKMEEKKNEDANNS